MPFRMGLTKVDVQDAMTAQGYTVSRSAKLDNLDVAVGTRAVAGDAMDLTVGAETKVKTQTKNGLTEQGYTTTRATKLDNLDATISSRAASGSAMDLIASAKEAIWNVLIPTTPTAGSYGERIKNYLNIAVSTRSAPGDAMDLTTGAETKVKTQTKNGLTEQGYTTTRASKLDNLDVAVGTRAVAGDAMDLTAGAEAKVNAQVDIALADVGVTLTRMTKLDKVSAPVSNSGSVSAASNTSGLTVSLDTEYRTVIEIRYSAGGAANFIVEGSDDGTNWYQSDSWSESSAVTNKISGYLNTRRYVRLKSSTTGIDLSFEIVALL